MFGVIMAGGFGTRFWPRSRRKTPKQLISVYGGKTMLEQTLDRISKMIEVEETFIVTNAEQIPLLTQQTLPYKIPQQNIISEPFGRNTAPAIALSAVFIKKFFPEKLDEAMVVLPSDHLISNDEVFNQNLKLAGEVAVQTGSLVTFGIPPTYPSTGYGYIQVQEKPLNFNTSVSNADVFGVKTFAEKPNYSTAVRFVESGEFFWNSGIFVWQVREILSKLEEFLPDTMEIFYEISSLLGTPKENEAILEAYKKIREISIDYGVMEKAKKIAVVKAQFGWNDLGSWKEVYTEGDKDGNGNVVLGNVKLIETTNCLFAEQNKSKIIAAIGINDLVIVDTEDALLVCSKERSQEVKEIVELLKKEKSNQYL
ncbi:mannose-1-phosphate guanylyltransferase [bacterium]|nr:mannose-1-phosphate guanylyltransferase [bacterium]